MKLGTENLILDSIFNPEVHVWPFLLMRNSKLSKKIAEAKTWYIWQYFTSKRKLVMYIFFANEVDATCSAAFH